jgi:sphinganine-1-phosphate aldolase
VSDYPYASRFTVNRALPEHGRGQDEILAELQAMATEEDRAWEGGRVSGTMYCGDHDHYAFLTQAFAKFAHVNALQRDLCPSSTRFEGEVIAMTLDLMHGGDIVDTEPGGLVTSGGTGSIIHAVLAYRDHARQTRGIAQPNFVMPETGHPAFEKGCHLFGVECRKVAIDPDTTTVTVAAMAEQIDENTVAIMGSAGNYPYGTIDPIPDLAALAAERGVGMHVDACLGGFILPFGEELGRDIPPFDFRVPGVTSISADTHKYGYAFKGSSVVLFRTRRCAIRSTSTTSTGPAASTCRRASTGPARQVCSPPPGRPWSNSAARAIGRTPRRSSPPPTR